MQVRRLWLSHALDFLPGVGMSTYISLEMSLGADAAHEIIILMLADSPDWETIRRMRPFLPGVGPRNSGRVTPFRHLHHLQRQYNSLIQDLASASPCQACSRKLYDVPTIERFEGVMCCSICRAHGFTNIRDWRVKQLSWILRALLQGRGTMRLDDHNIQIIAGFVS